MTQRDKTIEPLFGKKITTLKGITKFWDERACAYVTLEPSDAEQVQETPLTEKMGNHHLQHLSAKGVALVPEGITVQELDRALKADSTYQRISEAHFKKWSKVYSALPSENLKDKLLSLVDPQLEKVVAGMAVAYRLGLEAGRRSRG